MRQLAGVLGTVTLGALLLGSPVLAGSIAIIGTESADNGDDGGFVDTYETVRLYLTIENTGGLDLPDLTLRLSTYAASGGRHTSSTVRGMTKPVRDGGHHEDW